MPCSAAPRPVAPAGCPSPTAMRRGAVTPCKCTVLNVSVLSGIFFMDIQEAAAPITASAKPEGAGIRGWSFSGATGPGFLTAPLPLALCCWSALQADWLLPSRGWHGAQGPAQPARAPQDLPVAEGTANEPSLGFQPHIATREI